MKPDIDPRSDSIVLYHAEGEFAGVPARDLSGGDLARWAWVNAAERPDMPHDMTQRQLAKFADELVASGKYRRTKPDHKNAGDES